MPGNKKPRKPYKPKMRLVGQMRFPVQHAVEGMNPPDQKFVDRLRLQELGAIEAFATGKGTPQEWEVLAQMTNRSEFLGNRKCGPEAVPVAQHAASRLMASIERAKDSGILTLDESDLDVLRHVREYMDVQFQSLSVKELEKHFADMAREAERLRRTAR